MTAFTDQIRNIPWLQQIATQPRILLLAAIAAAAAVALIAAMWLYSPDFRPLYTNLEPHDGGAIVNILEQRAIPYRFENQGTTILVPADQVYALRLQLAEQGLPRSANTGFELLDEPKFGASQFLEQIQYQRALEGELARSMEALQPVQSARVHLALPRQSLFIREQEQPTASVLVNLYAGRTLSKAQVRAMQRLVAASVPRLGSESVSVIDQDGHLLSSAQGDEGLSAAQEDQRASIEQRTLQRILTLLNPIVGSGNVRAQVNAQIDFTQHEQTSERYTPNEQAGTAAVRSKQTARSLRTGVVPIQGIPGALSNQPPATATAPLEDGPTGTASPDPATEARGLPPTDEQSDATINYELDRTITHTRQASGLLENLSVAVVVSYRNEQGALYPSDSPQIQAIETLAKRAMGYSDARGDTISVINTAFDDRPPQIPLWQDPFYQQIGWQAGKALLWILALFFFWRQLLRPLYQALLKMQTQPRAHASPARPLARSQDDGERIAQASRYADNLKTASDLAEQDPQAVAMVLRSWLNAKNAKP
ncbi:flagellar basal-body MS-ring/collar protein FliF [Castellaniella sp.]|uniref:flagellar basal-body MS-ring/collar protein FliF n=1 Tax=Castellaniella sp. TaxID=1955812 RepID=UPI003562AF33